jgi:hypothetical protein
LRNAISIVRIMDRKILQKKKHIIRPNEKRKRKKQLTDAYFLNPNATFPEDSGTPSVAAAEGTGEMGEGDDPSP